MKIGIKGLGFYIPEKRVKIEEIAKKVNLHPKIVQAIGAESVSEADSNELPSEMGVKASIKAMEEAKINPNEIDIIINAPAGLQDYIIPPISGYIQHKIEAKSSFCFDIVQGCCGMLTGVNIAKNFIISGEARKVLVVSSDKWSAYTDYHSAEAVIFGDGAGAVIISNDAEDFIFRDFLFETNGKYFNLYGIEEGGVKNIEVKNGIKYKCLNIETARKEFKEPYIQGFIDVSKKILNKNRIHITDISFISMVNANLRLLEKICDEFNYPIENTNVEYLKKWGHVGGSDIFFNLKLAKDDGKIEKGDLILLLNAGIGFTWGACLIEY